MRFSYWLRLLPETIRRRIEHREGLLAILGNVGWLFGDRVVRMGLGIVVSAWLARYLGPNDFGLINYAMALVALCGAISSLGLNGVVVRDLVRSPLSAGQTLGSAFLLLLVGGSISAVITVVCVYLLRPSDVLARATVTILGLTLVFKASEVVKYWFESRVASKYAVWVENAVFIARAGVQIALIFIGASLMAFVWLAFAEALLGAIGLLAVYSFQTGGLKYWSWQTKRARDLLGDSWPLMLSSLAVMLYMRIDQIMLGQMLGDQEVGYYTAAVRLSEAWYFVPVAIVASVSPFILRTKVSGEALYYVNLQRLFNLMVAMSVLVAIPMSFLSGILVRWLYGSQYENASVILAIHIWTGVPVSLGVASSQWLLAENLQRISFYRTLSGAMVNVTLNFLLIPRLGGIGAALATLASQMTAAYLFDVINPITRKIFIMKTSALALRFLKGASTKPSD